MILANEVDGWGAWADDASFMLSIAASNGAAMVHSSVSDTKVSTLKYKMPELQPSVFTVTPFR